MRKMRRNACTYLAVHDSMFSEHYHLARRRDHKGRHHRTRLLAIHSAPLSTVVVCTICSVSTIGAAGGDMAIDLNSSEIV